MSPISSRAARVMSSVCDCTFVDHLAPQNASRNMSKATQPRMSKDLLLSNFYLYYFLCIFCLYIFFDAVPADADAIQCIFHHKTLFVAIYVAYCLWFASPSLCRRWMWSLDKTITFLCQLNFRIFLIFNCTTMDNLTLDWFIICAGKYISFLWLL